jgi:LysM repeat protein
MTRFSLLFAACALSGFASSAAPRPTVLPDSIGVEYRNNKVLIKHRVVAGETLYGISRRYKVPVDQIVEANPKLEGTLGAGQIVLVPRTRVVLTNPSAPKPGTAAVPAAASAATKGLAADARGNKVYKVEKGQTLFSIARRFGMTPADIARQNNLAANAGVRIGQTLIIVPAGGSADAAPVAAAPSRPATVPAPTNRPERADDNDRDKDKETPEAPAAAAPAKEEAPERAKAYAR